MVLTKNNIAHSINCKLGYSKNRCANLLEILLETIKKRLEKGEDVLISSFGKFCVKDTAEHRGRSSTMGNELIPDAKRVVTFKCSDVLKAKLNGKPRSSS